MTVALERHQLPTTRPVPAPEPAVRAPRRSTPWLVGLVALGAVLRFWGLGSTRLNYDESFTAMAGRLPLGALAAFLRVRDSHPPLDYLLRAPLARAGLSEFWIRTPSAILSLAALALFAWWVRSWGRTGVIATALMAVSTFQIVHGRQARMYAELELLGVAIAMLAAAWLTRPRRWHAAALAALVLLGLLDHVSMFLLATGLLALAGLRTDRDAWWWRGAVAVAGLGWALIWGPTFLYQSHAGHSGWIPPTTLSGLTTAVGRLVTFDAAFATLAVLASIAGGALIFRRDRSLGRVWICLFVVPVTVGALAGFFKPVVLDRTFTLMAWAPLMALAFCLTALVNVRRVIGAVAIALVLAIIVPATVQAIVTPDGPNVPLAHLAAMVRPGDIVAIRPNSRAAELAWSLGVRGPAPNHRVAVPGIPRAYGIRLGAGHASGRIWTLDWKSYRQPVRTAMNQCAPRWTWRNAHISCFRTASVGTGR